VSLLHIYREKGEQSPVLDRVYRGNWRYDSTTDIISYYVVKTILGKSPGNLVVLSHGVNAFNACSFEITYYF
jgi:hypothetical protein